MNEGQMDRFARGELSPAESRELARKALESPELFEELTSTAIAQTELQNRTRRSNVRPIFAVLATAAAVVAAISLYGRSGSTSGACAYGDGDGISATCRGDTGAVFRGEEQRRVVCCARRAR